MFGKSSDKETVTAEDVGSVEEVLGDSPKTTEPKKKKPEKKAPLPPVCGKCGSVMAESGCVCCNRH